MQPLPGTDPTPDPPPPVRAKDRTRLHQLRQRGTGHQHVLVDVELQAGEPGPVGQVGGGLALAHAPLEQLRDLGALGIGEPALAVGRRQLRRQVQGVQHQLGRLVQRIVGPVTEEKTFRVEAAGAPADKILDCKKPFGWTCHVYSARSFGYAASFCGKMRKNSTFGAVS